MPALPIRDLPAGLEALTELALDLRWTWSHEADALWERVDAEAWSRTRNPSRPGCWYARARERRQDDSELESQHSAKSAASLAMVADRRLQTRKINAVSELFDLL